MPEVFVGVPHLNQVRVPRNRELCESRNLAFIKSSKSTLSKDSLLSQHAAKLKVLSMSDSNFTMAM